MVVKSEPIPFMKHAFQYGAKTAREEALLKGLDASNRQTNMVRQHAGGAKMTVPQFHTGMTHGPINPNTLSMSLNTALTQHISNSEFDKLALSNSIQPATQLKQKGGKKSAHKNKLFKKNNKTKNKHLKKNKYSRKHK